MEATIEIDIDEIVDAVSESPALANQIESVVDDVVNDRLADLPDAVSSLVDAKADDIVQEVIEHADMDRAINDAVDSLINDQIEQHLERLDIDDINDFERRVQEIVAESVQTEVTDALSEAADPQDSDDRITNLEESIEALKAQVDALTEGLQAAAILLARVAKG